jgi:hypothetical protein
MVQVACPTPVPAVTLLVPVQAVLTDPALGALPRLVVQLVISVAMLAKIETTSPVTGAVLEVIVVPVWAPVKERLLTSVAQLVAVTVSPAATAAIDVCPHPESPVPVPQTLLRLVWNPL